MLSELLHVHCELDDVLVIMTHELKFDIESVSSSICRRQREFVRLLGVWSGLCRVDFCSRRGCLILCCSSHLDLLEQVIVVARLIDASQLNFRAIVDERDLKTFLHLPPRDLIVELSHEHLHHIIGFGVDDERSLAVEGSALQVDNDELASVLSGKFRQLGDSHA